MAMGVILIRIVIGSGRLRGFLVVGWYRGVKGLKILGRLIFLVFMRLVLRSLVCIVVIGGVCYGLFCEYCVRGCRVVLLTTPRGRLIFNLG